MPRTPKPIPQNKRCKQCLKILLIDSFGRHRGKPHGMSVCKPCNSRRIAYNAHANRYNHKVWVTAKEFPIDALRQQCHSLLTYLSTFPYSNRAIVQMRDIDLKKIDNKEVEFWVMLDTEGNRSVWLVRDKQISPMRMQAREIVEYLITKNLVFKSRMDCKFDLLPELAQGRSYRDLGYVVIVKPQSRKPSKPDPS